MSKNTSVRRVGRRGSENIVRIMQENFSGNKTINAARGWVEYNFNAFPRMQYFVITIDERVVGYILWTEHGGLREEAVWELEQIAIDKNQQGQGLGLQLIKESLSMLIEYLQNRRSTLKLIMVTTGTENKAQRLYQKSLGAVVEATVKNLYRGDEVIMIARPPWPEK